MVSLPASLDASPMLCECSYRTRTGQLCYDCCEVEYTKAYASDQTVEKNRNIPSFDLAVPGALWYHVVGFASIRRRLFYSYTLLTLVRYHKDTHSLWHTF